MMAMMKLTIAADTLCVFNGDLVLNLIELFDSLQAGHVLYPFRQYSIAFYSRSEAANDAISGKAVEDVGLDVRVKSVCSWLKVS